MRALSSLRPLDLLLPLAVAVFAIVAWLRVDLFGTSPWLGLAAFVLPLVLTRLLGGSDRGAVLAGLVGLAALTYAQVLVQGATDGATVQRPMVSAEVLPADRAWSAPRTAELLAPALFERPAPRTPGLTARAFLGEDSGPRSLLIWIGLGPTLLALIGVLGARGRAWAGVLLFGLAAVAGAGLFGDTRLRLAGQWVGIALAAVFAGLGYSTLGRPLDPAGPRTSRRVGPEMLAAASSVLAAAVLMGAAAKVGVSTDAQALALVLERLQGPADPTVLQANAEHLRRVLDAGALAAFAVMTGLLLHLKARRESTLALLTLVLIAELLLVPAAVL